jgi:hypothetical protein
MPEGNLRLQPLHHKEITIERIQDSRTNLITLPSL